MKPKDNGTSPTLTGEQRAAVAAAEAVAQGRDPVEAQAHSPGGTPPPATDGAAGPDAPAAPTSPPDAESLRLGRVAVRLTDALLARVAGIPAMDGPLADEAAAAWAAVIARYAPTLATAGPLAQLGMLYAVHVGGALLWTEPESSSSRGNPDVAKPPSSNP